VSAGTSVTGGLGGVFYLVLLIYSVITKPYNRKTPRRVNWAPAYALPIMVVITLAILVLLNLTNYGVVRTRDTLSQQFSTIVTSANEWLDYLIKVFLDTFPIVNDIRIYELVDY